MDSINLMIDVENLTCNSWNNEPSNKIKTALCLTDRGENGSSISWTSSNPDVITDFGRVIIPNWNQGNKAVTMTATLSNNGETITKSFDFTVLSDEVFVDPQYMSDETFFGKWENGKMLSAGKLDYSHECLQKVETAVMQGDYIKAKDELLLYCKQRNGKKDTPPKSPNKLMEMVRNHVTSLQHFEKFYKGEVLVSSTEYEKKVISIITDGVSNGVTATYDIVAKYNEVVGLKIAGKSYPNANMHPKLEIVATTQTIIIDCVEDAFVASGIHRDDVFGEQQELSSKTFGEFTGDNTYHSFFKFDIDGLKKDDNILSINLVLYMKKDMDLKGDKEAYVILFSENTWNTKSVSWGSLLWQYANRDGLPQTDDWDYTKGFDVELLFQRLRFGELPHMVGEYNATHDEKYIYYVIKIITDFINVRGCPVTYTNEMMAGSGWKDDNTFPTLCSGWPRALDSCGRGFMFARVFDAMVQSSFINADICTAFLKFMEDNCDSLAYKSLTKPGANIRQHQIMNLLKATLFFPEFVASKDWFMIGVKYCEEMIFPVTLQDGTNFECTGGYSHGVCADFILFRKICEEYGVELSKEFNDCLKKLALYNTLLQGPSGENLQYGDQGAGVRKGWQYPELIEWFNDPELNYVLTRGEQGIKPKWTSYHFPVGSPTMLRSSWDKEATFLFTQVRGGGSHGHEDDHHITLLSKNRTLLCDAGVFTYNDDPFRWWGTSPVAHNTVAINSLNQLFNCGAGKLYEYQSNNLMDIISQGTNRYEDFEHIRTIFFAKPDFFIVSDRIIPKDKDKANDYRQIWHMLPNAKMQFDYEGKRLSSNFQEDANIAVVSADNDAIVENELGWYDYSYQQISNNPFGYFKKAGVIGEARFDTVLQVFRDTKGYEIKTEHLESPKDATALKVIMPDVTHYYMRDENKQVISKKQIGRYATDAQTVFISENKDGTIANITLLNGSTLYSDSGDIVLDTGTFCEQLSLQVLETEIVVETSIPKDCYSKIKFNFNKLNKCIKVNGEQVTL